LFLFAFFLAFLLAAVFSTAMTATIFAYHTYAAFTAPVASAALTATAAAERKLPFAAHSYHLPQSHCRYYMQGSVIRFLKAEREPQCNELCSLAGGLKSDKAEREMSPKGGLCPSYGRILKPPTPPLSFCFVTLFTLREYSVNTLMQSV
jgi:hypothetical protein